MKRLLPFQQFSIICNEVSELLSYDNEYIMYVQFLGIIINDFNKDNFDYSGLNFMYCAKLICCECGQFRS
ncbi:hypothetical protein CSV61_10060 [Sporosarcina sp. P3]|nr:hypothetical protein CSV61_10060 [Sporosarcina sp. P3]